MKRLLVAIALFLIAPLIFAAAPVNEIICYPGRCGPCGIGGYTRDFWTAPGETVTVVVARPQGCTRTYSTSTPSVIAFEASSGAEVDVIHIHALVPGEGELSGTYYGTVARVHVQSCADRGEYIRLAPAYTAVPDQVVSIVPEIHGNFDRGMFWSVNGVFYSMGPPLLFFPPANGVYTLALRGESGCGVIEAKTTLLVGAQRVRAVRAH